MDIDEMIVEETLPPEAIPGHTRPDGIDPESGSWLDIALLSKPPESAEPSGAAPNPRM